MTQADLQIALNGCTCVVINVPAGKHQPLTILQFQHLIEEKKDEESGVE